MAFAFDNSYARDLQGFYAPCQPEAAPKPALLFLNHALAEELGLDFAALDEASLAELFAGNALPEGATPIAQAYAGHQFGNFSPQLGDGRALLIGEVIDRAGRRRDISFKGSGRTPFSRGGDGRAAIGPMLREALVSEAMHALGLPTTRALAVAGTGERVLRELPLPGANLTRVAASHLRVGTFEYFARRGDDARVRQLADYAIARHDPELLESETRYADFLRAVMQRQAALVARWMGIGFIHGVMNTDNMSIAGETIDYGPCAFMEAYDPQAVFSSIDHQGRYAYRNQPPIAQWNLARLAEALLPLLADDEVRAVEEATAILNTFPDHYLRHWLDVMRAKLGLQQVRDDESDTALAQEWLALLHANGADFTQSFRLLADAAAGDAGPLRDRFIDREALDAWLARWYLRCAEEDGEAGTTEAAARAQRMRMTNPRIIPRNHLVEEALQAASRSGDLQAFEQLLAAIRQPYSDAEALARYAEPAPAEFMAGFKTFCGT